MLSAFQSLLAVDSGHPVWRTVGALWAYLSAPGAYLILIGLRRQPSVALVGLLVLGAPLCALASLHGGAVIVPLAIAWAYLIGMSCLTFALARLAARGRVGPMEAAAFAFLAFLVLPSHARGLPAYALLLRSWEVGLSAYGFICEARRRGNVPTLGHSLRFLLVDPTHVFVDTEHAWSGHRGVHRHQAMRVAGGSAAFLALAFVSGAFAGVVPWLWPVVWLCSQTTSHMLRVIVLRSVLAMGGVTLPDCYRKPWAASSPADFWRRWNLWVGRWASLHIFVPFARSLRGARNAAGAPWRRGLPSFATFAVVGLLHDAYAIAANGVPTGHATAGFVLFWMAGVGWDRSAARLRTAERSAFAVGTQRLTFASLMYVLAMYWS